MPPASMMSTGTRHLPSWLFKRWNMIRANKLPEAVCVTLCLTFVTPHQENFPHEAQQISWDAQCVCSYQSFYPCLLSALFILVTAVLPETVAEGVYGPCTCTCS
jgi:hypothetical protein